MPVDEGRRKRSSNAARLVCEREREREREREKEREKEREREQKKRNSVSANIRFRRTPPTHEKKGKETKDFFIIFEESKEQNRPPTSDEIKSTERERERDNGVAADVFRGRKTPPVFFFVIFRRAIVALLFRCRSARPVRPEEKLGKAKLGNSPA